MKNTDLFLKIINLFIELDLDDEVILNATFSILFNSIKVLEVEKEDVIDIIERMYEKIERNNV